MTRKRYIKLIMSTGRQRNDAHALADKAVKAYGSYQEAWKFQSMWYKLEGAIKKLGRATIRANTSFEETVTAYAHFWERIKGVADDISGTEQIQKHKTENHIN